MQFNLEMNKLQDQDRMSEVSFGSTISLHSIGSDGGFSPKPPSGTRKLKKNRTAKVKNKDSPYGSLKASQPAKKTGRELWVTSIRQGIGMSNESSGMNTWNGIKSPYTNQSKATASTSSYLLDQLLQSTGRAPKNHTRSSSFSSARVGGNGPAYKTAEEYYDEVVELKKRVNTVTRENEMIRSKMHKVEEENIVKARQIEELMNPSMQSNHMRRTLTDKKQDSSAVVTSLKHKLHSVERVVKSKDSELSKLKNDMKFTDIAELQLQIDMYHEEVQRLNLLLTEPQGATTLNITSEIKKEKTPEGKLKKYGEAVQVLSEDNARLLLENNTLKQDLRKAMEMNAHSLNISKEVEDMSRAELLAKISALEQQLKEEESKDAETPQMRKSTSQQHKKYPGKAGEEIRQLEEKNNELIDELDKQKETITKLKEDRTHYRKLADEYRVELGKYKQVGDPPERPNAEEVARQRSSSASSSSASTRKQPSSRKQSKATAENATKSNREKKEHRAATTIQRNWRKHKQRELDEEDSYDQAVLLIQSAFRGHKSRNELLLKRTILSDESDYIDNDDDYEDDLIGHSRLHEDDVILMQSAFRGHKARREMLKKEAISSSGYNSDQEPLDPPRFRRSFDTGHPVSFVDNSKRFSRGNKADFDDRDTNRSLKRGSQNSDKYDRDRSSSRGSNRKPTYGYDDNDNDDDDDDDDVVIGSTSSLNSNDRFEQSYLNKTRFELTGGSGRAPGQHRMPSIEEQIERKSKGNASMSKLQRNSTSWDTSSKRQSNVNDFLSDSEEDDAVVTSSYRKKSQEVKKDKDSVKRNSLETSISKINNSKMRRKESARLADKWATSGTQSISKKQEKSLISSKLSSSPWKQVSKGDDGDEDDDDEDDLVVAPTRPRTKNKKELEDELY